MTKILLNIAAVCHAETPFRDFQIDKPLSKVYRIQEDEMTYLRYVSRVRKTVRGRDLLITHRREEIGETIEAVSEFKGFRPIYCARLDNGELIYRVSYNDDYAEVFIPKGRAEKSQSGVPRIFKKILGIYSENDKADSDDRLSQEEIKSIKKNIGLAVPTETILKRMTEYKDKNKMIPSKEVETRRRIKLPEALYSLQDVSLVLENFPFETEKKVSFHLSYLPHPMVIWKMVIKQIGEEKISVPAGSFQCYKLKMETSEWWSFLAFGLDDVYVWVMKDYPRIYVKSTFPFAGWKRELVNYSIDTGEEDY